MKKSNGIRQYECKHGKRGHLRGCAILLLLCLAIILPYSVFAETPLQQDTEKRILVIETTDVHGYIMDVSSGSEELFQYRLARIAQLVNEARSSGQYDDVMLLDGGDIYQGTPVSYMTGGAVMRAAFDTMGYDAVGLGNHEFDWEVTEYATDRDGTMAPYVLGDYFGDAKIPVLACNLYDAASGERVPYTKDYAIINKAGLRIAVIGYIPNFRNSIMTARIAPYTIDDDLSKLDALVRKVNEDEKPDATVIIVHDNPIKVAEAMDPSQVDLVVGGHTNDILAKTAKSGVAYIQGYYYGYGFASAVLVISANGSVRTEDLAYTDISADKESLLLTEENTSNLDPDIVAISRAGWDAIRDEMSETLGYIDTPVLKKKTVGANSAGNWITGLMLEVTQPQGAVMAFYNNGGIRTSFNIPEGQTTREITVGDIYSITPFGNTLLLFDINGRELAQQLADGLKAANYGDQMSGLTFTYSATGDKDTPRNERGYTILSITLADGTEVDMNDTETLYRVCTTNYNATVPGSVFEGKEPVIPEADSPVDNESYVLLLREIRDRNNGYIPVDTSPRGVEISTEQDAA
ncbi:MAG: bifunctional metallophosphatase/5'-nucleotidase [Oscillospiraceae bacterium]|nr:bifunctional metallophosphatase/5'-nucleotidase [Oscillospiraceae bacterium]